MKRMVIGLVIGFVLIGGGFLLYQRTVAAETQTTNVSANTETTAPPMISAEGQLVPLQTARLAFEVNGQVAEILVAEGDVVQTGDPIIRLNAAHLELQMQEAEAALAQAQAALAVAQAQIPVLQAGVTTAEWGVTAAQAQLDLLLAPPRPEEIAAAEANIAAAQAGIAQAAGNRDTSLNTITDAQIQAAQAQVAAAMANRDALQEGYDHLIENNILGAPEEEMRLRLQAAEAQLASAQAALDALNAGPTAVQSAAANAGVGVAAAQRDAAQAQLDLLQSPVLAEQVQQAEQAVQQAQSAVTQTQVAVQQGEAAVTQAEAGAAQAQTALQTAQAALDRMTLKAPFDGTIASLLVEIGEVVTPGTAVAILADMNEWLVKTESLTELDVVSVVVGEPVDIYVDALPDKTVQGTIIEVASASNMVRGDVTYTVTIRLPNVSDLPLRWGMTVFVDIQSWPQS